MKQAMIDYMKKPIYDELYTPDIAVTPLLQYVKKGLTVWEPTDHGSSNITKMCQRNGNVVISSHIGDGVDFLKDEFVDRYDVIITNPPYSLKTEFLRRAYELGKPFAFLLPLTSLEGVERGKLYREYGIELLVMDRRINFMKNKKNVWFNTSWFCRGLLDKPLHFVCVGEGK